MSADTSSAQVELRCELLRLFALAMVQQFPNHAKPELMDSTINLLRALAQERDAMEAEAYDLRLTILGGEDAPGFAGSIPLDDIKMLHLRNTQAQQFRAERAEAERDAARAEVARLREALELIASLHIPDQPAAYDCDDLEWAQRHVGNLRGIARAALRAIAEEAGE